MTELNLQKAAAAKGQLGPSSLLAFWKHPVTSYITCTSLPGKRLPYWSSFTPLRIPSTQPLMQYAALGCIPPPLSTQINTLAYYHKTCRQIQCPRVARENE